MSEAMAIIGIAQSVSERSDSPGWWTTVVGAVIALAVLAVVDRRGGR